MASVFAIDAAEQLASIYVADAQSGAIFKVDLWSDPCLLFERLEIGGLDGCKGAAFSCFRIYRREYVLNLVEGVQL